MNGIVGSVGFGLQVNCAGSCDIIIKVQVEPPTTDITQVGP